MIGAQRKHDVRRIAFARRQAQPDKEYVSRQILARLSNLPEYAFADSVMFYVSTRHEVRTRDDLAQALESRKRIVVPYCVEGQLQLFHLQSMDELETGRYGILEPKSELRTRPDRRVEVGELDLIVVPGVAFDRHGSRLGHGKGYYDRLLAQAGSATRIIGLAFECQMFDQIPSQEHDIRMDKIVTEVAVYRGRMDQ